jgi:hypothetical protein
MPTLYITTSPVRRWSDAEFSCRVVSQPPSPQERSEKADRLRSELVALGRPAERARTYSWLAFSEFGITGTERFVVEEVSDFLVEDLRYLFSELVSEPWSK